MKKKRDEAGLFVAEGAKTVFELLGSFECCGLFVTEECLAQRGPLPGGVVAETVTREELSKASLLTTPHNALGLFRKSSDFFSKSSDLFQKISEEILPHHLCLALDDVQDPGNLGTIIRLADWFGIRHLFCSLHTADAYSPKTVQASMGSLARVKVYYGEPAHLLEACAERAVPVYGTFLNGDNIYTRPLAENGLIVMGNEGNGISAALEAQITDRLWIPGYPPGSATAESLNVATATAIVCAEFRRRMYQS